MGIYSERMNNVQPTAVLYGHPPAPGVVGEIAMTQAVIKAGQEIPLPQYADGSVASEDEVFWTVHLWQARWNSIVNGFVTYSVDGADVIFSGRLMTGTSASIGGLGSASEVTNDLDVLVTVFAIRKAQPVEVTRKSLGDLKKDYR